MPPPLPSHTYLLPYDRTLIKSNPFPFLPNKRKTVSEKNRNDFGGVKGKGGRGEVRLHRLDFLSYFIFLVLLFLFYFIIFIIFSFISFYEKKKKHTKENGSTLHLLRRYV